jgi:hypothetical protein
MCELWLQIALPVVTGVVGWATNAYRNAQKKESDIISNFQAMRDADREFIEECRKDLKESRNMNKRLEAKYNRKCKSVRAANKCKFTDKGEGCPVLAQEERNEHIYDADCSKCEHQNTENND